MEYHTDPYAVRLQRALGKALGRVTLGSKDDTKAAIEEASDAAHDLHIAAVLAPAMDLPKAAELVAALEGRVTVRTAHNWTSGKTSPPAWLVVLAADVLAVDPGALCRAFAAVRRA